MSSPRERLALRKAKVQRLQALELQQARQGDDTPPHIATEIERLQAEIALMDTVVVSPEVVEAVPGTTDQIMLGALMKLTGDVGKITGELPGVRDIALKVLARMHIIEQDKTADTASHSEAHREMDKNTASHSEVHRVTDAKDAQQFAEIRQGQRINRGFTLILLVIGVITLVVLWQVFG